MSDLGEGFKQGPPPSLFSASRVPVLTWTERLTQRFIQTRPHAPGLGLWALLCSAGEFSKSPGSRMPGQRQDGLAGGTALAAGERIKFPTSWCSALLPGPHIPAGIKEKDASESSPLGVCEADERLTCHLPRYRRALSRG